MTIFVILCLNTGPLSSFNHSIPFLSQHTAQQLKYVFHQLLSSVQWFSPLTHSLIGKLLQEIRRLTVRSIHVFYDRDVDCMFHNINGLKASAVTLHGMWKMGGYNKKASTIQSCRKYSSYGEVAFV